MFLLMLGVGSFLHVRRIQTRKKLWRILLDTTKCTEVRLSYVCNNISTLVATQLCNRLRQDLLLAARFFHVQQRLIKTPKATIKQIETKWPELHHAQQSSTHLIQSTTPQPTSNEMFAWFGGVAWPHHINTSVHAAIGCWRHPRARLRGNAGARK